MTSTAFTGLFKVVKIRIKIKVKNEKKKQEQNCLTEFLL